jgi:hypothetical protein
MKEIYYYLRWVISKAKLFDFIYAIGMLCIVASSFLTDNKPLFRATLGFGLGIILLFAIYYLIWCPIQYSFNMYRKEKEKAFEILKSDKYSDND